MRLHRRWKWRAKDANGQWFVYMDKPEIDEEDNSWFGEPYECLDDLFEGLPKVNWRDSLEEIQAWQRK